MKRKLSFAAAAVAVAVLCFFAPVSRSVHAQGAKGTWLKVGYTGQTTTVQTVQNGNTALGGIYFGNTANSAPSCMQVFDVASSTTVTLGTTAPTISFEIPTGGAGGPIIPPGGLNFVNGLKFAIATSCTNNTAPASGLDVDIFYQ